MATQIAAPQPPETLIQAVRFFADHDTCQSFLVALRWPDGNVTCPTCGSTEETYIGGKLKNMHKHRAKKLVSGAKTGGYRSKMIVMGLLERGGRIRTQVIADTSKRTIHAVVADNVEAGAELMTDANSSYGGLGAKFMHQFIDHVDEYVHGHIHTNGIENFWSLLKRALRGTYVSVEPFHLHRYVEEEAFRY